VILGSFSCTRRALHCANSTSYFFAHQRRLLYIKYGPHCHAEIQELELYRDYPTNILGCFFSRRHADLLLIISYRRLISVFMKVRISPQDSYSLSVSDESTRQLNNGDQSKLDCTPHFNSGKTVNTSIGGLRNRWTLANRLILSCELVFQNIIHWLTLLAALRISRRFVHNLTYQ